MDAHPYYGGGYAVIDTCESCGQVWLDAGELALIGNYVPHHNPSAKK
jgi:Zn-finger nucleic acid-binding protein